MLFLPPQLSERELAVIADIEALRQALRRQIVQEPRRWSGSLRRQSMARAIKGSNSIEGFDASLDDALAVDLGQAPLDADVATQRALEGYRDAMTYVIQLAGDPAATYSDQLLKSLHFIMTRHDLVNRPGLWRFGAIFVRDERDGIVVHEGPDVDLVPELVGELVDGLNAPSGLPTIVRAGMAHLNLVMIHPFRDGNGRMARCLQSLVLAKEGVLAPAFCSIEEYLGRNTQAYYDVLAATGGGTWQPERDTLGWTRFILTSHLRQARTVQRRIKESERLWDGAEDLARRHGLVERTVPTLFDAAMGYRVTNSTHRAIVEAEHGEITESTAGRDLAKLVDAGVLESKGERRGRSYVGAPALIGLRRAIIQARDPRDDADPFA